AGRREVAGKDVVAGQAEVEGQVLVDLVVVLVDRVPDAVAVDVQVLAAAAGRADLRTAVDREPRHEVAAGLAVAAGEGRHVERLAGVALAVELVAGHIDDGGVENGEGEAVIGQGRGEVEGDGAGGGLAGHRRGEVDDDAGDGDEAA